MTPEPDPSTAPARAAPPEGYRADIQGLRAIAVLSVVLYHANEDWLGGGFVGVDIFFVISGYLITGILAREITAGKNSIAGFYRRRIRRLFPALFAMLAATVPLGWWLLQPADFSELGRTIASTVLFASNFDFLALSDYFGGEARLKPLLHTWSLAVEEQFYIVFPLLLALLWRVGRRFTIATLCVLGIASLGLSSWLAFTAPSAAFYLAPSRAFELLSGSLLAIAPLPVLGPKRRNAFSTIGLGLIVLSLALIGADTPFPGFVALAPCLGSGLMIYAGRDGRSRAGVWISNPVFVFFGAISYSLYLWHWPLLAFARHWTFGEMPPPVVAGAVTLAIAAAYVSYRFIEQPFLKANTTPTSHVLIGGAATMAAGIAVGLTPVVAHGFPQRFSPHALALFASADDFNPRRPQCHQNDERIARYADLCVFGADAPPSVAVWGDSYGAELVVALGERLRERGASVLEITATACPPAPGYETTVRPLCVSRNEQTLRDLSSDARIHTVVMAANYAAYRDEKRGEIEAGLHRAVATLTAAGKRVVIVGPIPIMPSDPPSALGMLAARGQDLSRYGAPRAEHDRRNAWAFGVLASLRGAGAFVVDPASILCDQSLCRAYHAESGASLYYNRTHIDLAGARLVAAAIPLE